MKVRHAIATTTLVLVASLNPAHAAGTVELSWVEPGHYSDAGRGGVERERTLAVLGEHLQHKLGSRLPDGQTLRVEVLDLDLAGEPEPARGDEVRVLRGGADWPRIALRYTLQADGRTIRSGQVQLADMSYLATPRAGHLAYEKHLLDEWFAATVTAP